MLITTNRTLNNVGFDRKQSIKQCIVTGWGNNPGMIHCILRSVVVMKVVNQ